MANPFVHVELATTDYDKAKSFYGQLFNWKLQDMPMGNGVHVHHDRSGRRYRRRHDEADGARRPVGMARVRQRG